MVKESHKAIAQGKYCKANNLPYFAPVRENCSNCHRNVFAGYTMEQCKTTLITGCPFCHKSFVD